MDEISFTRLPANALGGEKRALPTNESATGRPKSTCNQEEQLVGDGPVAVAVGGPRLPPACRQAGRPQSRRKKWSGGMHAPGPGGEALGDPHRLDARTAHPSLGGSSRRAPSYPWQCLCQPQPEFAGFFAAGPPASGTLAFRACHVLSCVRGGGVE